MRRAFIRSGFTRLLLAGACVRPEVALAAPAEPGPRGRAAGGGGELAWDRPRLVAEGALGAARHTGHFGAEQGIGPSWHARVGAQFGPALGLEAHYAGAYHEAGRRLSLSTAGLSLDARLSLPLDPVRVYVTSGFGWYKLTAEDADGRPLLDAPWAPQVPLGAGVEWLVDDSLGVAAGITSQLLFAQQGPRALLADTHLIGAALSARAYF